MIQDLVSRLLQILAQLLKKNQEMALEVPVAVVTQVRVLLVCVWGGLSLLLCLVIVGELVICGTKCY